MTPRAAMIFAAGFGTRMGALTRDLPKPMVPLGGRPMIDHAIALLRQAGIGTIVANTHHLPDRIEPHLHGSGVMIHREAPGILDTGGGLRAALPLLGEAPVITINPDALWLGGNPVQQLVNAWQPSMQALLSVIPSQGQSDFDLENGVLRRTGPFTYGGAQIIRTDRLHRIEDEAFSLNAYWDLLATDGALNGLPFDGEWYDIGTPRGLAAAEERLRRV